MANGQKHQLLSVKEILLPMKGDDDHCRLGVVLSRNKGRQFKVKK